MWRAVKGIKLKTVCLVVDFIISIFTSSAINNKICYLIFGMQLNILHTHTHDTEPRIYIRDSDGHDLNKLKTVFMTASIL